MREPSRRESRSLEMLLSHVRDSKVTGEGGGGRWRGEGPSPEGKRKLPERGSQLCQIMQKGREERSLSKNGFGHEGDNPGEECPWK